MGPQRDLILVHSCDTRYVSSPLWMGASAVAAAMQVLILMLWCACLLCTAGDSKQVAQQVADQLRIPHFHATLKPDDKLSFVTSFRNVAGRDGNGSSQPAQRPGRGGGRIAGHA